jgi:LacI family transcriptional regulator
MDRERGPATIAQVAARAQVSTATVSRVLSGRSRGRRDTRERVLEAAAALDYRPSDIARSLKRQATRTLGLLVTDILNPYFPQLVRAVEDRAHESGYALLLGNGTDDPAREAAYLESLAARRVDGLLIAASRLTRRHAATLERLRAPTVLVNCESAEGRWPSAMSANHDGGRLAAEHLLALGHRHLGFVTVEGEAAARERRAGVEAAMREAPQGAELHAVTGGTAAAAGELSAARLLAAHPEVTGIVCYNDALALGVLRGVRAAGRTIPGEASVVGFDDIDLAAFAEPPLPTIRQDIRGIARWAVDRLLEDLRGPVGDDAPFDTLRWPVELITRGSTAPPPA